MRPHDKNNLKRIALERIDKLFAQAALQFKEYPELSRRYVVLARKMAMKFRVRFTPDQRKLFCKTCNAYLVYGVNCRMRLVRGRMVRTCLECASVKRKPFK